jgi:hypothetical protein
MNPDFVDLLRALSGAEVRFLIVGAYALALYSKPRATGDLDVWVEPTPENATRVIEALKVFGAPLDNISQSDFAQAGVVFQIGVAPRRIDILTELTGVTFQEAWSERVRQRMGPCEVDFIGRRALIQNKRILGRTKDLADLEALETET